MVRDIKLLSEDQSIECLLHVGHNAGTENVVRLLRVEELQQISYGP